MFDKEEGFQTRSISPFDNSFKKSDLSDQDFAHGCTLLRACGNGDSEKVATMLAANPHLLHFSDYDRRTALHVAASEGHLKLVEQLLVEGANPNRSDRWGGSPLDDSQRHRFPEVAEALRKAGGRGGVGDHTQSLIVAASKGDSDAVRLLLAEGANPDSADYDKRTALHLAACEGHTEVLKLLVEAGANVHVADRWDVTPIDEALRKGHHATARELERVGAKPNLDEDGHRPMSAKRSGRDGANPSPPTVPSSMMVDWNDVQVLEKIGSGAFGDIFKCRWRGTLVAAKTIKAGESLHGGALFAPGGGGGGGTNLRIEAVEDFKHEINFLLNLRHPNICLLLGYSLTAKHEVMLAELMKCSLLDVMKTFASRGTPFSLERTMRYAIQFAQGMSFLHTCKPPILHRDLKPANLLLDFSDTLKVSDFGLAKLRPERAGSEQVPSEDYQPYNMTGETGSYRFMAPEVYRHEAYGRPVDVYSFAMILYHMLVGEPPWAELDGLQAVRAAAIQHDRPQIPRHIVQELSDLCKTAWADDPKARPSFTAVLELLNAFHVKEFKVSFEDAQKSGGAAVAGASADGCCALM
jgi:hypothetical protein